jgi:acyl carrier protein
LGNTNLESNPLYAIEMDSLEIVQLMIMVKNQFNIEFDGNDFTVENLSILGNLCNLVLNKTKLGVA